MHNFPARFASRSTYIIGGGEMDPSALVRYFLMSCSTIHSLMPCRYSTEREYPGANIFSRIAGSGRLETKNLMGRSAASFSSTSRNNWNASPSSHSPSASITTTYGIAVFTASMGACKSFSNCHLTSGFSSRTLHKVDRNAGSIVRGGMRAWTMVFM